MAQRSGDSQYQAHGFRQTFHRQVRQNTKLAWRPRVSSRQDAWNEHHKFGNIARTRTHTHTLMENPGEKQVMEITRASGSMTLSSCFPAWLFHHERQSSTKLWWFRPPSDAWLQMPRTLARKSAKQHVHHHLWKFRNIEIEHHINYQSHLFPLWDEHKHAQTTTTAFITPVAPDTTSCPS